MIDENTLVLLMRLYLNFRCFSTVFSSLRLCRGTAPSPALFIYLYLNQLTTHNLLYSVGGRAGAGRFGVRFFGGVECVYE